MPPDCYATSPYPELRSSGAGGGSGSGGGGSGDGKKKRSRRKNSWSTPRSAGVQLAALALQTRGHASDGARDDETRRLGQFEV